jgi:hypothetical protein
MRHVFATNTLVRWYEADKIPSGFCPFCPLVSAMSTWPIPNGTSAGHPN